MRLWLPADRGRAAFSSADGEAGVGTPFHERPEIDSIDPDHIRNSASLPSAIAWRRGERTALGPSSIEGRIMLSGTKVDGIFRLRAAILCFRTHVEHIDLATEAIRDGVAVIDG
jgi:hypothetical protein